MPGRKFYDVSKFLKQRLDLDHPVHVRRVKMPKQDLGDCSYYPDDKKFVIRIERNLGYYMAVEVLLHEMAHALAWDKYNERLCYKVKDTSEEQKRLHGPKWGKAYSQVYQHFLEYLDS